MKTLSRLLTLFLISSSVFAGIPLITFNPLTPTAFQLSSNGTAIVQYTVQNQSRVSHTFMMVPILGVTQITTAGSCPIAFALNWLQSCTLTLEINGKQIPGKVAGGPIVCQQGPNGNPNPQLCYQPSPNNLLNITAVTQQPTFYVGTQNGSVYYSQNNGATWTITATMPATGNPVNSVFATNNTLFTGVANGFVYYSTNKGQTWHHTTAPDGSAINCIFINLNLLFAGTQNGFFYYSANNGATWNNTTSPDGSAVTAIFINGNTWYAGTANGNVFASFNQGATWSIVNAQPDGSAIKEIFIADKTLFVNTANEYVFSSSTLTGTGTWETVAQSVYSLFVNPINNILYAGTQSGYVFSITAGDELGFVAYSPINSIYILT